ncbi:phosphate acetyltransferase [Roseovarius sp. SCSIO 43702]|uniref:phosphate acyltransferase n=1 Tax=Roseovarius sp. SCSIO 43702 TaxID=2823043 RepID=UPI001C72CE91|nr:phosphate acyltransferase [Roseovarius sp. SCSIO 43702]QYX57495.1 phosphate acetyltransferase [Roseovarius sp. SCSIO 43702]
MTAAYPFLCATPPQAPAALLDRARSVRPPRVALVNAGAENPLNGIREAMDEGLAEPILIGDTAKIEATAQAIEWDISGVRIIHAPRDMAGPEAARLVREGEADAIMKGQIHTSTFLKQLLPSRAGLREKGGRCGHVFHITAPGSDRPLFLTDAAMNVDPDVETRKACLAHAVGLAQLLGNARPKAGILSPTEDLVETVPNTIEARQIETWAKEALPHAVVQGPMAMDLILSAEAAQVKGFASEVAGDADIILTPNITTGNAVFKIMAFGMGCCCAGVVLGLKVPLLLTSRAQEAPSRIASAALGAIVAAR